MRSIPFARTFPLAVATAAALQSGGITGIAHAAKGTQTFKGATQITMHGPVQVSIVVKGKKITNVKSRIAPNEDGRSPFLQQNAMPILKKEVLKAQGSKVDVVSGATETSLAYVQSLKSAIKKARKVKALK